MPGRSVKRVHPEVPALERHLRVQPEAELLHHTPREDVLLGRDRHDAREAELAEGPGYGRGARLGRDAAIPPRRVDRPADLRVVRPGEVILRTGPADELARLAPLDREQAERVLVPVALPAVERRVALRARLRAREVARERGVGVPARERLAIGVEEAAEEQPLRLEDVQRPRPLRRPRARARALFRIASNSSRLRPEPTATQVSGDSAR
jgi:hypothetical protein